MKVYPFQRRGVNNSETKVVQSSAMNEVSFIHRLGSRLKGFKQTKEHSTFTCKCLYCSGNKKDYATTAGFFPVNGQYLYKCQKCKTVYPLPKVLKDHAPELHQEYMETQQVTKLPREDPDNLPWEKLRYNYKNPSHLYRDKHKIL